MTESQLIAGRWALPTVESNVSGVVHMHVSVSVPEVGAMSDVPIQVGMVAGGTQLTLIEAAGPGRYYYLETLAVTLVADYAFVNPEHLTPQTVTITIEGESATFEVSVPKPDDGFPIA